MLVAASEWQVDIEQDAKGSMSKIIPVLAQLRAIPSSTDRTRNLLLKGSIPSARIHDLQQLLPTLTSREGFLEYGFDRYELTQS